MEHLLKFLVTDRAIDACIKIINYIMSLPEENNFNPYVSIGINSSEMVYGNIGSPTLRRLDFTVIVDTVNTAQRLQSTAKQDEIVITEESYEKVKQPFECVSLGKVTLKNKSELISNYKVLH